MNFKSRFFELNLQIWVQILLLVLLLSFARQITFFSFSDLDFDNIPLTDYFQLIKIGGIYDLRVSSISYILLFLIGILATLHKNIFLLFQKIFLICSALISFIFMFTAICNFFYFETYGNNFDVFIFGVQTENPKALLETIWHEYPVVLSTIISLFFAFLSYQLAKITSIKNIKIKNNYAFIIFLVLSIFIFLIATRGSIETFPLRKSNARISEIQMLNKVVPNAFMSLDWAYKDYKENSNFEPVNLEYGIKLLEKLFGEKKLVKQTNKNEYLEKNKPHVVLTIMESMGSNLLNFDNHFNNDLLGELREHFSNDFLFENFLGNSKGTKPALANILFNSPYPSISHNSLQKTYIKGSIFELYQKANYKVIFISPGNMMWHNMSNFLNTQGVQVVDENSLIKMFPESKKEKTDWGVFDEYAYRYAKTILNQSKEPLFIVILSITNHPPFAYPKNYQPKKITIPNEYQSKITERIEDSINTFQTFQYSADSLGKFISSIKHSNLSNKTIIAATGDHNFRRVPAQYPKELVLNKAVPFYIYIPKEIQNKTMIQYRKNRFGSHKDILPTLISYSLSEAKYFNMGGRNILGEEKNPKFNFGYSEVLWIDEKGVYHPLSEQVSLYQWSHEKLLVNSTPNRADEQTVEKINAYKQFDRWQFNYRVMGTK